MKTLSHTMVHLINRVLPGTLLTLGLMLSASPRAAELLSPDSVVNGASMPDLVRQYMAWSLADPGLVVPQSPKIYSAPSGNVAFAPTTTIPGSHLLNFDLMQGTPLLLASLYWGDLRDNDQTTDIEPCNVAADRFACVQQDLKSYIDGLPPPALRLKINGVDFEVGNDRRFDSAGRPMQINLTQDTGYGLPAGDWNALYDGWFAVVSDFAPGLNRVEYGFSYPDSEIFHLANINVVPLASSAWLLSFGFFGLLGVSRSGLNRRKHGQSLCHARAHLAPN
jgi:hypothetical protein